MLLSPPDLVSMTLMMIPVQLLFEITVVIARVMERRRAKRQPSEEPSAEVVPAGQA